MDLHSLRSAIDEHRRPSGRLTIHPLLRAKILEVYATWRDDNGSQKKFVETLGLKASSFSSWLAASKDSKLDESTAVGSLDSFRKVRLSTTTRERAKLTLVLPNGTRLKGLSLDQALALLEKLA